MQTILVLGHVEGNGATLTRGSLEAIAAGCQLAARSGATLAVGALGLGSCAALNAATITGAKLLAADSELVAQARYSTDAAACEALCRATQPTLVLAPQSSRFSRVMAGVACRMAGVIDTHITAIRALDAGQIEVSRWFYRQRIEGALTRPARPWFLLLETGASVEGAPAGITQNADAPASPVEVIEVPAPATRTTVEGLRSPTTGANTIRPDAKLLFVAGAGWTRKQSDGQTHASEAGDLILGFLAGSGASLGSTKSLVDQGCEGQPVLPFLTHMNQVGQTGATPRHAKGLSTCCHGEEPHVVGWRFVPDRRAISIDPNCGWARGKADVVYVADAFQVMRKVNELLNA